MCNHKLRNSIKPLKGIYGIKNLMTKKILVGSASNVRGRLSDHLNTLQKNKHANKELQEEFNTYGIDAFHVFVFSYKIRVKLAAESKYIRLLLNNNVKVYNSIMPITGIRIKIADKNTARYIIKDLYRNRTYTNVTNLTEFRKSHSKGKYPCPSETTLYKMLNGELSNTRISPSTRHIKYWSIEIDKDNTKEDILRKRGDKIGNKESYCKRYYQYTIQWKITNIITKEESIITNLMKWCDENKVHYNRFQRYKDSNRIYLDTWKLEKVKV